MSVQRYDFRGQDGKSAVQYHCKDGEHVLHADYAALEQRLRDAEARIETAYVAGYDAMQADLTATKARCAELKRSLLRALEMPRHHPFAHSFIYEETACPTCKEIKKLTALAKLDAGGGEG